MVSKMGSLNGNARLGPYELDLLFSPLSALLFPYKGKRRVGVGV